MSTIEPPPPTRWARATAADPGGSGYARRFAELVEAGADVDGEARLADVLVGRGARILDVGTGMGRVAAGLARRGHDVVAIEPDATLREQAARTYPDLEVLPLDAMRVDAGLGQFDLIVCVGNVLVYLAEGTERPVLGRLAARLAPGGRMLAGFHLTSRPGGAREYPPDELVADARASGLRVEARFGSYELHPANDDYAVWILTRG